MEVVHVTKVTTQVTATPTQDTTNPPLEQLPAVVTKDIAAQAIMAETGCSKTEAYNMLQWLEGFVLRSRDTAYIVQYPSTKQMSGRNYEIFDQIFPHGSTATVDSAADLCSRALLDSERGELNIMHDQKPVYDRIFCTVQVSVVQVSLT
jgi:hypothetical protein